MALGLAVNARGADHNRSGAYQADLSDDLDRLAGGHQHVLAAVETEDRAAIMDSVILCKFLRGVFVEPFAEWAGLARLLEEPLEIGSGRVARLTPERLRAMIDGYYEARGLEGAGRPEAAALDDLGLVN